MSAYLLEARQIESRRVVVIVEATKTEVLQWNAQWRRAVGSRAAWVRGEFAYHEMCALLDRDRLIIWDPTDDLWLSGPREAGYAGVRALRICPVEEQAGAAFRWGDAELEEGGWFQVP